MNWVLTAACALKEQWVILSSNLDAFCRTNVRAIQTAPTTWRAEVENVRIRVRRSNVDQTVYATCSTIQQLAVVPQDILGMLST